MIVERHFGELRRDHAFGETVCEFGKINGDVASRTRSSVVYPHSTFAHSPVAFAGLAPTTLERPIYVLLTRLASRI